MVGLKDRCNPARILAAACFFVPALAQAQAQQDSQAQLDALRKQQEQNKQQEPAKPEADTQATPDAQSPQDEQSKADAQAKRDAVNSLPGSSRPMGLSLSPEAPPAPPAPGGRAPSFGAPTNPDAWTFRIGGRISGFAQLGLGRRPEDLPDQGSRFHSPPLVVGRAPFWAGPGGTLTFQYGNQTISAFASVEASMTGQQWEGYYRNEYGPRIRTVYLAATPAPIGDLKLRFQVGAFPSNYGSPGPWGWGIFGPVLAIHGYGGTATADYDLAPDTKLNIEYGVAAVPAVDEAFVRGTYADWPEVGYSTIVNHVHPGISYKNKYFAKLHLARAQGRNMRTYMDDVLGTAKIEKGSDGHMDVAALEMRWMADPFGELGVTPVFWNFKDAVSVHNGIWWGMDWTAGSREMSRKFLGPQSNNTGKIFAVSAEYDFSLKRILMRPKPFDGNGPDLRVALAFLPFWTLKSVDPNYDKTSGYFVGSTFQYVVRSWISTTFMLFGESRDSASMDASGNMQRGRWLTYSGTAGVILHSDWQSQDRIVFAYSRYFYSNFTDSNPMRPLDRNVFTLGGSVAF